MLDGSKDFYVEPLCEYWHHCLSRRWKKIKILISEAIQLKCRLDIQVDSLSFIDDLKLENICDWASQFGSRQWSLKPWDIMQSPRKVYKTVKKPQMKTSMQLLYSLWKFVVKIEYTLENPTLILWSYSWRNWGLKWQRNIILKLDSMAMKLEQSCLAILALAGPRIAWHCSQPQPSSKIALLKPSEIASIHLFGQFPIVFQGSVQFSYLWRGFL